MNKPLKLMSKNVTYSDLQSIVDFMNSVMKDNPEIEYKDFELNIGFDDFHNIALEWTIPMTEEEVSARDNKIAKDQAERREIRQKQYLELKKEFESE